MLGKSRSEPWRREEKAGRGACSGRDRIGARGWREINLFMKSRMKNNEE